ncbi:MAG TPA: TlpA disulfide reductase family protein [Euzebyales bacterium]|nr:TlpA disulfide reductase family protein [Euzebyales bacterium]
MTTTSSRSKKNKKRTSTSRSRTSRGRGRRPARGGGNLFIWIFLGVLVVLFAVIAFVSRSGVTNVAITNATVSGQALPEFGNGPDGAVGQRAPTITGTSITGERMTVEPGDGTPKAIAFLAHWCPHCQREVPTVVDWAEAGNVPDGVEVIGVATGIDRARGNFPPHDWFERETWDFPTVVDGDDAARNAYGIPTYPGWVLVDGEGNVVMRWTGETTPEELTQRIGQLAPQ